MGRPRSSGGRSREAVICHSRRRQVSLHGAPDPTLGTRRGRNSGHGGRPPGRTVRALNLGLLIPEDLLEGEELAHRREESSRDARTAPLPDELDPRVRGAVGVDALYLHQRAAWEAAARGEHLVVTTGTASGKTLAFNLPVLNSLVQTPRNRVLYLYPTKALAQDQFRTLNALRVPKLRPAIYDGDTPTEQRWQIRKWANAILTNPDMVHIGLLPNHERWGDVLSNLRYVVLDEAHVYRGIFGSHVANVLRRLRRMARIYGSDPQFLLATATIANPGELGQELLGEPVTVIGDDGAPRADRTVVLWNPPLLDAELGLRGSALAEAAKLQAGFVDRGLRTLTFAKSRKAAELVHRFTAERLGDDSQLSPYRAGYTAGQRREIERRLAAGELLGVSSTDALELGIDIGLLDAVISVGFPGTVASLRQQWGRAGRRGHGLAVLVATEDALDQYFMREPDKLLGRRVEAAILDHTNPRVLAGHVRAAAYEAPIDERDRAPLGSEALEAAAGDPELRQTPRGIVWAGKTTPAASVALRSADPESFTVVDGSVGAVLGHVERSRAYSTVHAGAVYLHAGASYIVHELDETAMRAVVEPFRGDWYTQPKRETETTILGPLREERRAGLDLVFGEVEVTDRVVGYERKTIASQERIELVPLECPPTMFETEAIWFCPEPEQLRELDAMPKLLGTLHAAEHSLIAMLPLWAMCDRWDIGGLSTNSHPDTGRPTIFIYDGHPGGVGITERGFEQFEEWVADTARMLEACPCHDGCPSCVQSPKCGNLNDMLDKAGARTLLERLGAAR
ncbi:MAG TPA: DEAD/DEAH box helicase [Gaiellaceae bacterium]|nr:DEAD/DEAH box helicase [Gaiellaceae bacterium]